jgi:hypothetical protein
MLWFKKKTVKKGDDREKKIQAIHKETLKQLDQTTESIKNLNKMLDDPTYKIFLATGGDKRK